MADPPPTESIYQRRRPFRVIVRLSRDIATDAYRDLREAAGRTGLKGLSSVLEQLDVTGPRLITALDPGRLREIENRRDADRDQPSLTQYWQIDLTGRDLDPNEVAAALTGQEGVDVAYVEAPAIEAGGPDGRGAAATATASLNHLDAAPIGSNVRWAWEKVAGFAADVQVLDVESGWDLSHEALKPLNVSVVSGVNQFGVNGYSDNHGTAALGIVAGMFVAPQGVEGICSPATVFAASPFNGAAPAQPLADVLVAAVTVLHPGDVVLIEVAALEDGVSTRFQRPIERDEHVRQAILLLTGIGIVVIEPAGNGNKDLAKLGIDNGRCQLDINGPGFVDSHAVLVGGAFVDPDAAPGSVARRWVSGDDPRIGSNFGNRVNCYSWARQVYTSGCAPWRSCAASAGYQNFNGTSSASAIIAGVAVLVQTMLRAAGRPPLTPDQMRAVLADAGNGTASEPNSGIGPMPDLERVAAALGL
ncbi:MAG: S8 family serine peptidase [Micropruina sp.]